jgi:hypothetical protein
MEKLLLAINFHITSFLIAGVEIGWRKIHIWRYFEEKKIASDIFRLVVVYLTEVGSYQDEEPFKVNLKAKNV